MYNFYLKLFGYRTFFYDVDSANERKLTLETLKKTLQKKSINFVILVNPSPPIEKNWSRKEILGLVKFCQRKKITLMIDEVYQMMGSKSSINLVKKFSNLIIIRSFSKSFGYPGLRMGYLITSEKLKYEIESYRLSIELTSNTIEKSIFLMKNFKKILQKRIDKVIRARKFAHEQFRKRKIRSFGKFSSSVSFLFKSEKDGKRIIKKLRLKKIHINHYKDHLSRFGGITTTNISNLKKNFKNLDKLWPTS